MPNAMLEGEKEDDVELEVKRMRLLEEAAKVARLDKDDSDDDDDEDSDRCVWGCEGSS